MNIDVFFSLCEALRKYEASLSSDNIVRMFGVVYDLQHLLSSILVVYSRFGFRALRFRV